MTRRRREPASQLTAADYRICNADQTVQTIAVCVFDPNTGETRWVSKEEADALEISEQEEQTLP